MKASTTQTVHEILSGRRRGAGAALVRGALAAVEPGYAAVMSLRNRLYDRGVRRAHVLDVPVISVGNITAGGTGKTPVVRWLATELVHAGLHPAILMRGYKRSGAGVSDEQAMLQEYLRDVAGYAVPVHAQADRMAGGGQILREHPQVDVIVLDDGFQHRRLARDFDLVLIDASNPFGYGHVHPRGLLREPLRGLRRADAFVLTRADQVAHEERERLEGILRSHNPTAPIYRAQHAHTGLRSAAASADRPADLALSHLAGRRFFVFAGIANPQGLNRQITALGGEERGYYWFGDHHDYSEADVERMRGRAKEVGAELILTTEKDWAKLRRLPAALTGTPPILRLEMQIQLDERSAQGLMQLIQTRIRLRATRLTRNA